MSQRYFEAVSHAAVYAKFRPIPPKQLGERILDYLKKKYQGPLHLALDVGCGNGQSATLFSDHFEKVIATDISEAQIVTAKGLHHPANINFHCCPAEKMPVQSGSVQIVSASQACHWFDLPAFFAEVDRVLCRNGVLVLSGYTFPKFSHPTKANDLFQAMNTFYQIRTGPYWGSGREHVDNEYVNIKLPYEDSAREDLLTNDAQFTLSELIGYLTTWSGYQNFCKAQGESAGNDIIREFSDSCLKALETKEKPEDVTITLRRKYFMLLGRKVS